MVDTEEIKYLKNKTILIISPQPWGNLYVSKYHYAIELAKHNIVYFLSPITSKKSKGLCINITPIEGIKNLNIIEHHLFFSFHIKFHFRKFFRILMRIQSRRIIKKINNRIDIVWSFDLGNYFPFDFFNESELKIFHPVDEPLNNDAIDSAKNSDIIFSVTNEILEKYNHLSIPKHFVNHGVSESFLQLVGVNKKVDSKPIHVGLSGNLRRKDIDRETLLKIVDMHKDLIFDFWGEYKSSVFSFQKENVETDNFIEKLQSYPNVKFQGILGPKKLAEAYQNTDIFLICYDVVRDQSKGTNYHKILEFLSTGKVIVSNNVTTYCNLPNLVNMINERDNNNNLPDLFNKVVIDLQKYNTVALQQERIAFAKECSYEKNLLKIDRIINQLQTCVE